MAAPEKPATMVIAAARQRCSPASTAHAKAIRFGQAFCTFDVCVACGGGQGVHTPAAQPPYAKMATKLGGGAPFSLPY